MIFQKVMFDNCFYFFDSFNKKNIFIKFVFSLDFKTAISVDLFRSNWDLTSHRFNLTANKIENRISILSTLKG
jgi:hypothetical protein